MYITQQVASTNGGYLPKCNWCEVRLSLDSHSSSCNRVVRDCYCCSFPTGSHKWMYLQWEFKVKNRDSSQCWEAPGSALNDSSGSGKDPGQRSRPLALLTALTSERLRGLRFVPFFVRNFFPLDLLGYNCHTTLCMLKMHNVLFWYMYILCNYYNKVS